MQGIKAGQQKACKISCSFKVRYRFLNLTAWIKTRFEWAKMFVLKKIGPVKVKNGLFQGRLNSL